MKSTIIISLLLLLLLLSITTFSKPQTTLITTQSSSDCEILNEWQRDISPTACCTEQQYISQVAISIECSSSRITLLSITDISELNSYIPPTFGLLTQLSTLRIQNSTLVGEIPNEIGQLSNLNTLNLENNSITGGIPSTIGNLSNLSKVYLSNNQIDGSLPGSITRLTKLEKLDFSGNKIGGYIPTSISNLVNLAYLDLSNNRIIGELPMSITRLETLELFDIENNSISGSIDYLLPLPSYSLLSLSIGGNAFAGTFGDLSSFAVLSNCNLQRLDDICVDNNNINQQPPKVCSTGLYYCSSDGSYSSLEKETINLQPWVLVITIIFIVTLVGITLVLCTLNRHYIREKFKTTFLPRYKRNHQHEQRLRNFNRQWYLNNNHHHHCSASGGGGDLSVSSCYSKSFLKNTTSNSGTSGGGSSKVKRKGGSFDRRLYPQPNNIQGFKFTTTTTTTTKKHNNNNTTTTTAATTTTTKKHNNNNTTTTAAATSTIQKVKRSMSSTQKRKTARINEYIDDTYTFYDQNSMNNLHNTISSNNNNNNGGRNYSYYCYDGRKSSMSESKKSVPISRSSASNDLPSLHPSDSVSMAKMKIYEYGNC